MLGTTAVALIHANDIHALGESAISCTDDIAGLAGTFKAVDNDKGRGLGAILLPVTMAEHRDTGLNLDQARFRLRKRHFVASEEGPDGLLVAAAQKTMRTKRRDVRV